MSKECEQSPGTEAAQLPLADDERPQVAAVEHSGQSGTGLIQLLSAPLFFQQSQLQGNAVQMLRYEVLRRVENGEGA